MPYPWTAHDILTAADLNAAIGTGVITTGLIASATYAPTWVQGATISKTTSLAVYDRRGPWVDWCVALAATSAGTAANVITVTLPVATLGVQLMVGTFFFVDASTGKYYAGTASNNTTTTARFVLGKSDAVVSDYLGTANSGFALAIASGDSFFATGSYPAA